MAPARQEFDDCWLKPAFARRWVLNNTEGFAKYASVREFWLKCVVAQLQGIDHLCKAPTKILDVGCGPAIRSAHIKAKVGCEVIGVDYSPTMIEQAEQFVAALPEKHRVQVEQGDVRELRFEDEEFDVVIAYGLLMGVPFAERAAAEMMRVSKFGLVVIEETPDVMTPAEMSVWEDVKDKKFPGRIYWHNYPHLFFQAAGARQVIIDPLVADESWAKDSLGVAPGYARYIAVK